MWKRVLLILAAIIVVVGGIVIWMAWPQPAQQTVEAVTGVHPKITDPREETIHVVRAPETIGWAAGAAPTPAKGLKVAAFARDLDTPRWLYRLPNGDVLVAETAAPAGNRGEGSGGWFGKSAPASPDRILLLRDANGDGVAEQRFTLRTGLKSPFGMALIDDKLYVATNDAVLRFPFHVGDTSLTAKPEKVMALPAGGDHWTRNLAYDPNTKRLYVAIGSGTNIADQGVDAERLRATVIELDPATGYWRSYASGLRNPVGMDFEPHTGRLFTVVDEREFLGGDLPPDYLTEVELGAQYGWPWAYWGGYTDHRVTPEQPDMLQYFKRPDFALGPHVTPLGLAFATDARLGTAFANGAFVGEHGSWNRIPVSGYRVVFVPFGDKGYPAKGAKPVDVLTGFLTPDGKQAHGRPVGVIEDAHGGLLVADDAGNTIWRVTAATN
jgi:glucose/arabinose dehydrogenase